MQHGMNTPKQCARCGRCQRHGSGHAPLALSADGKPLTFDFTEVIPLPSFSNSSVRSLIVSYGPERCGPGNDLGVQIACRSRASIALVSRRRRPLAVTQLTAS